MDPFDLLVQRITDRLEIMADVCREVSYPQVGIPRAEAFEDVLTLVRRLAAEVRAETDPQDPDDPVTTD